MEEISKTVSQVCEKINKMTILTWIKERRETEKQRDTKRPQWNRMKNPEINSCIN